MACTTTAAGTTGSLSHYVIVKFYDCRNTGFSAVTCYVVFRITFTFYVVAFAIKTLCSVFKC